MGSAPDVDSDFHTAYRDLVLEHCEELYGRGTLANIVTFSTLAAKAAFKTMCTIYSVSFAQANRIAALIPGPIEGVDCTLDDIFSPDSSRYSECGDFRTAVAGTEWIKIIEGARAIEGRVRATGVHPCGIVISSKPLIDSIPLQVRQSDGRVISQWTYKELESLGLLKFDFLGLDTVDLIAHTVEYIQKTNKAVPNMMDIIHGPMDDKKTFAMLSRGETDGLFQLSSPGVKDLLRRMKPTQLEDIVATTALYRPGPMGMNSHIKYADRKNGREKVEYPIHPDFKGSPLEKILDQTYFLCVFQEQIIQIANQIGGMTLQEGDDLRSAMGKKKKNIMAKMKPIFIKGGFKNGYSEEALLQLWATMEVFAEYGFNKCAHGRTLVSTPLGKFTLEELYEQQEANPNNKIEILSLFEDGELRSHQVKKIVKTGRKPVFTIRTASGKRIRITEDHRMLSTTGYATIGDGGLAVGTELMTDSKWTKRLSPRTVETKRATMASVNRQPEMRKAAANRMAAYQTTLTLEQRSIHQKRIQEKNPERTTPWLVAGRAALAELRDDEEWSSNFIDACEAARKLKAESGEYKGFGRMTKLSNGEWCDSAIEALAGEYLISRNVEFEVHKKIINEAGKVRVSDFYANGLYFEMDGLGRGREYFIREKYGNDVPFVYMTPLNYKDVIDLMLMTHTVENGDPIVSIEPPKVSKSGNSYTEMTFDIEMEDNGPSNFVADGLISHNSHSVAYAINAYQSAFLKANYPVEFMAALLSQNIGRKEKILAFIQEAKRMKLKVGSADINISDIKVAPDYLNKSKFDVVYGLSGINAVSIDMARIIVNERETNGDYKSVQDVISRCSPLGVSNKKIYENLALAGGFDTFGHPRRGIVENLPHMLGEAKTQSAKGSNLFDLFGATETPISINLNDTVEFPHLEKLKKESDVIGLYLTSHPLANVGSLSGLRSSTIDKALKSTQANKVKIVGSLTEVNLKRMKRGGKSIAITLDDGSGFITAFLNKEIVRGLDKQISQDKIRSLYENGAYDVPADIEEIALNQDFQSVKELETGQVYSVDLAFRPGFDDNPYSARISKITKISLAADGSLPVRMRLNKPKTIDSKREQISFIKDLATRFPGESPIYVAYVEDYISENIDSVYRDAIDFIKSSIAPNIILDEKKTYDETSLTGTVKRSVKKTIDEQREWPPPKQERGAIIASTFKLDSSDKIESFNYKPTKFSVAKGPALSRAIEEKLGIENYDFGIFNPDLLKDN